MIKKGSGQNRMILISVALACTAAVFSVFFFSYLTRFEQTVMEENRSRLREVSGYVQNYMARMIEKQFHELSIVAASAALMEDGREQTAYFDNMADTLGLEYIGIAGRDGLLRASVFSEPMDISEEAFYKAAMENDLALTDLVRQIFPDRAVGGVILAAQLPDGSGRVIVALLSTAQLGKDLQADSFDGEGYSYIIDQKGNLVLHQRSMDFNNFYQFLRNMSFESGFSLEKLRGDIEAGREGMAVYSDLGVDKYAYYRPLGFNGWTVISTVPEGVITERTALLSRNVAVMCAAALVIFLLLLIFICVLYLRLESRRRANQAKSAFLANMSHDMRTPMNAIIGMASIAQKHAGEPETVRDCTRKIDSCGKHLLGLINDVLDMSKIESGKMILSHAPSSLPEVLENTVNLIYPAMQKKRHHFEIRLHRVVHENFLGDSLRLSQVFVNILTNAAKFTPEGGRISADIEELPQQTENTGKYRFTFSDNGIGMKPEFLKHIFSAFTREQDSKVDKIEGSGLGMAISKRIVDFMGGKIEVTSQEGRGSTFTVTLALPLDPDPPPVPAVEPCRVLVVDANEAEGMETVSTLESVGIRADCVTDKNAAAIRISQAAAGGEKYALALLDRNLFESRKWVATAAGEVKWALAAYDWEDIRAEAAAAGICYFLQKPLFGSTLLRALRETAESAGTQSREKGWDFTGKNILLAEDNELNMEIVQVTLTEAGAATACARNGRECVEIFRSAPAGSFDLVLMDIQMPEMNGCEAARAIRSLKRPDAGLPIVAMSANAFTEDIMAARKAGMTGYLTKPIDLSVWMKEIGKALGLS